jgi:hypothetical protein
LAGRASQPNSEAGMTFPHRRYGTITAEGVTHPPTEGGNSPQSDSTCKFVTEPVPMMPFPAVFPFALLQAAAMCLAQLLAGFSFALSLSLTWSRSTSAFSGPRGRCPAPSMLCAHAQRCNGLTGWKWSPRKVRKPIPLYSALKNDGCRCNIPEKHDMARSTTSAGDCGAVIEATGSVSQSRVCTLLSCLACTDSTWPLTASQRDRHASRRLGIKGSTRQLTLFQSTQMYDLDIGLFVNRYALNERYESGHLHI